MSVITHLTNTASKLIITDAERIVIDNHITALSNKLLAYYGTTYNLYIAERFSFGSYTRKTLMPRKADNNSDVDYMVVFKDDGYVPSTYLQRLTAFAESKYATSEIYQSHPTIVLELSKIKIELVPALKDSWDNYQIPAPADNYSKWLTTHPNAFNTEVTNKNINNNKLMRPLIRLMKYWNALNGKVYSSYELEKLIVKHWFFSCQNLRDYAFSFVEGLSTYSLPLYKANKIDRLKEICKKTKDLESDGYPISAESEIRKAFPEY